MKLKAIVLLSIPMFCMISTAHADPTPSKETLAQLGKPCDKTTFIPYCDNDILVRCANHKITATNCLTHIKGKSVCADFKNATPDFCDPGDIQCRVQSKRDEAACVPENLVCQNENTSYTECETSASGRTSIHTYTCEKSKNGRLVFHQTAKEMCHKGYGVCSEDGKCTPPIPCTLNYESNCDNNIASNCVNRNLLQTNCSLSSPIQSCVLMDGKAKCISSNKTCNKEGEITIKRCHQNKESYSVCTKTDTNTLYSTTDTRPCFDGCLKDGSACKPVPCDKEGEMLQICQNKNDKSSSATNNTYRCTSVNGKRQWIFESASKCDNGMGTCSEDGKCIPAESCDKQSFEPRCENNVAFQCVRDSVKKTDCSQSKTPKYCYATDRIAACSDVELVCKTEGQILTNKCMQNKSADKAWEQQFICVSDGPGKLKPIYYNKARCDKGCNAEKTGCAK